MILKTMGRKGAIAPAVHYLFKDEQKLITERQKPIVIKKNLRASKLENIIKEFEINEASRIRKSKRDIKINHTVISFHGSDTPHLNEKVLRSVTKEYMKLRGDNIYLATVHFDKESHVHIHCLESGTGYMTGKSSRITKEQFRDLKLSMQEFQKEKYPELSASIVRHSKKKEEKLKETIIEKRATHKQQLKVCVEKAQAKSKNLDEFLLNIIQSGHEVYYCGDTPTGIKYEGNMKYRFSRLGFDAKKLEAMKIEQDKEQEILTELDTLRSQSGNFREYDDNTRLRAVDEEENQTTETNEELHNEMDDECTT
jgi:hypothetical protein